MKIYVNISTPLYAYVHEFRALRAHKIWHHKFEYYETLDFKALNFNVKSVKTDFSLPTNKTTLSPSLSYLSGNGVYV